MPIWLQMTAAVSAALASGVMGAALVPFLGKYRFCEPEQPEKSADVNDMTDKNGAKAKLRPTMCGLLLCFGILSGLVLSFALYRQFSDADLTGRDYQSQSTLLQTVLLYSLLLAAAGFVSDVLRVRHRLRFRVSPVLQVAAVFLVALGLLTMQQGFVWTVLPAAAIVAVCWKMAGGSEHGADGMSITLGAVQCLVLTVVLLAKGTALPALYTLTAAGACMGCMVWNLHPAKCQLGDTGRFLLGSIVPIVCAAQNDWDAWKVLALNMAVYAVNLLPLLRRKNRTTLLGMMKQAGLAPWKRITLLAVFAVFCGTVTLLAVS
ncbi:MAG: hypothetical protein K2I93_05790 [Oscillospiraceae bacterium]|nr:hypothetical protein [Oscillospiraceae bacterium]